jgi:hypothetical protein
MGWGGNKNMIIKFVNYNMKRYNTSHGAKYINK